MLQICEHCQKVVYCDFFPCNRCHFRPMNSDICVKLRQRLKDDQLVICNACHRRIRRMTKAELISALMAALEQPVRVMRIEDYLEVRLISPRLPDCAIMRPDAVVLPRNDCSNFHNIRATHTSQAALAVKRRPTKKLPPRRR